MNCRNGFGHTPLAVAYSRKGWTLSVLLDKAPIGLAEGTYISRRRFIPRSIRKTRLVGVQLSHGAKLNTAIMTVRHPASCRLQGRFADPENDFASRQEYQLLG
jgi:hypothetical protein